MIHLTSPLVSISINRASCERAFFHRKVATRRIHERKRKKKKERSIVITDV